MRKFTNDNTLFFFVGSHEEVATLCHNTECAGYCYSDNDSNLDGEDAILGFLCQQPEPEMGWNIEVVSSLDVTLVLLNYELEFVEEFEVEPWDFSDRND